MLYYSINYNIIKKIRKKLITVEESLKIVELYKNGMTTRELCIMFDYGLNDRNSILNILKKYNIPIRKDNLTHATKYHIDKDYFKVINSEDKAYYLGLLYADGYNDTIKRSVRLSLQKDDKKILDLFKTYLKTDKPLRFCQRSLKNPKWSDVYTLDIENKQISIDLHNLGCVKAKTFLIEFPNFLENKYISHFIRGYFDGDGCITYSKPKKITHNKSMQISFVGTYSFLMSLQEIFIKELNYSYVKFTKRYKNKNDNIYTLAYGGNIKISKFKTWLYKDAHIFLDRKYDKFL
jgi:hypothetical protein